MKPFASLPMYDWPEVRDQTDAYWQALASAFEAEGLSPPPKLSRDADETRGWDSDDLFFSQTCGLPFRLHLADKVTLLATPDYGVEDCPPGYYRSAIIAARDDSRAELTQFSGASYGYNAQDSQSGFAALKTSCEQFGGLERHLGSGIKTGAHRASVRAVARGTVELAAIDAISWKLAQRHEPDAKDVKVIGWSKPTPGLPYITAKGINPDAYRRAIPRAIKSLPAATREALMLKGCVVLPPAEYLT